MKLLKDAIQLDVGNLDKLKDNRLELYCQYIYTEEKGASRELFVSVVW